MTRQTVHHIHDVQVSAMRGDLTAWLAIPMSADGSERLAAFFTSPADARRLAAEILAVAESWETWLRPERSAS